MRAKGVKTEFFNISKTTLSVLRCVCSGVPYRREIEDKLKISENQALRVIDKLAESGLVTVKAEKSAGRGGKGARLYACYPTASGYLLLEVCTGIEKFRKSKEK